MDASELLTQHLPLIERTIAFACRRHRLDPADAEDFASIVKLRLVEDDYAILRKHEARCSMSTFMSIVVQRMALDYRIHTWGKWHASAEAKRNGAVAVELEQLLHRDGRSLDEALVVLAAGHEGVTRESLEVLANRLPARVRRPRDVEIGEADAVASADLEEVEAPLLAGDRRRTSARVSALMSAGITGLPAEDRLILQLHFEGGMRVVEIARMLRLDQKQLYRRIHNRMRELRTQLEASGIAPADVLDLIGRDDAPLAFELRKAATRPSIPGDQPVATGREGTP